jgi:hypothetical protein
VLSENMNERRSAMRVAVLLFPNIEPYAYGREKDPDQ